MEDRLKVRICGGTTNTKGLLKICMEAYYNRHFTNIYILTINLSGVLI